MRQGLPEGLAGQARPPVWEAPRGRPTFFLLSGWAVLSQALREVRVPCAESGCILWIWGAAHRVGVLRAVEVDLQSGCILWVRGAVFNEIG